MGNSGSSHDFSDDLKALCAEGEQLSDKKPVKEMKRGLLVLKGSFGTGKLGKRGVMKDSGLQLTVGQVPKKAFTPNVFRKVAQLAQIDDAHVMRLVSVSTTAFPVLVTLEYCAGEDLESFLAQKHSQLSLPDKMGLLAQVADGLATLEAQGLVHGHMSLRSVLVFEAGAVFKVGNVCGELSPPVLEFLSPQQLKGAVPSAGDDVWSFAMLVHAVLAYGASPAPEPGAVPTFVAPVTEDESLVEVLERCFALEPVQRPDFFWLRADFEERVGKSK